MILDVFIAKVQIECTDDSTWLTNEYYLFCVVLSWSVSVHGASDTVGLVCSFMCCSIWPQEEARVLRSQTRGFTNVGPFRSH